MWNDCGQMVAVTLKLINCSNVQTGCKQVEAHQLLEGSKV